MSDNGNSSNRVEFKPGDRVRFVRDDQKLSGFPKGYEATVLHDMSITDADGDNRYFMQGEWEAASPPHDAVQRDLGVEGHTATQSAADSPSGFLAAPHLATYDPATQVCVEWLSENDLNAARQGYFHQCGTADEDNSAVFYAKLWGLIKPDEPAIDPTLLTAREICAEVAVNSNTADKYRKGVFDNSHYMTIALKALRWGEGK